LSASASSAASAPGSGQWAPRRLVYLYRRGGSAVESLTEAFTVAAAALLVSNGVRRCMVFEAYDEALGLGVRVEGGRVRGLAPQETAARGIARSLIRRGRWPGAALLQEPPAVRGCAGWRSLLWAPSCPGCVLVESSDAGGFKPRWLVAGVTVVYDEGCGGCCRG